LIAAEIARLIDTEWTTFDGARRRLAATDFMVVAPFNDQVRTIAGQVQGCGVRGRRVIPRLRGSGGECRWGGLLF
jgi:hypothetical protein